ncbi:mucin-2 [Eupeodes corollae]|uniref:mucin-2 n=1 Tax=Eupeodes corollae TaxID=290404 RepID=UPI00249152ED|nr:mucin-2 [Eupeodes corollae]
MISWKRYLIIITVTVYLQVHSVSSVSDRLVPPPLPPSAASNVAVPKQHLQPALAKLPSPRGGPPRPPPGYLQNRYQNDQQPTNNEPPGFMQRIARWFGFNGGTANEQQNQASQQYAQYKESPRGGQQNGKNANCGLCSKYPWVPMFPGQIQYPLSKHYQLPQANQIHQVQWTQQQELLHQQQVHRQQQQQYQNQQQQNQQKQQFHNQQQQQLNRQQQEQQQLAGYNYPQHQKQLPAYPPLNPAENQYAPTHLQPPLVQRAIQFSSPPSQDFRPPPPSPNLVQRGNPPPAYNPQPNFAPIPLPNLSPSALPPVYDAQPFRPIDQVKLDPTQFQQLPKYQPSVEFQNQPPINQFEDQQPPRYDQPPQFQQVQNNEHSPIAEHVAAPSEIQTSYPTQIPPSSFDNQNQIHQTQTTPSFEIIKSHQVTNFVSEIEYPANFVESQSIDVAQQPQTTTLTPLEDQRPPIRLTELGSYSQQYTLPQEESQSLAHEEPYLESDSIYYHNHQEIDTNNNYAPDNYPSASSHNLSVQNDNLLDIDPIQQSSSENYLPQNEIFLPTPEPTTTQPQQFVTDIQQTTTTVEIVPSLQTTFSQRLNYKRDRETPKRLLDSPIHYLQHGGSSPRPFTRDPASLNIREPSNEQPIYQNHREEPSPSPTPTPFHMAPTPTSTYTSIDASGHFAGINPPAPQGSTKKYHQIIIPYTTKHKPRPFTPKEQAGRYDNWSTSSEFDPHEQQESKVVTATHPPGQRTTKYLTKILASNLRELLKKEHEIKNRSKNGFDLSKLQNTIDDWTEQEFTSLSHRASTVSLRGHSKHIPTEYLTTTPSLREAKTTIFSPNHHEPLLYKDRGTRRYEFNPFEDNRIEELESTSMTPVPSTSTITTTTTPSTPVSTTTTTTTSSTTTTTEAPSPNPYYIRAISTTPSTTENWNHAKVTVSPFTKEKIYVVTPQPGSVGSFKSPRFIVRPTPASAGSNVSPKPTLYTPELFGLMGISAYIPAAPVETFDGHSKVITVVTPSNISKGSNANEVGSSKDDDANDKLGSKSANSDHRSSNSSS